MGTGCDGPTGVKNEYSPEDANAFAFLDAIVQLGRRVPGRSAFSVRFDAIQTVLTPDLQLDDG